LEIQVKNTHIKTVQGDITRQAADAIVNAANSGLMGGGGVDGAIHRAGGPRILAECKEIVARRGYLPPGQAVMTSGGNLPAKYVIHTRVLSSAYAESLRLADSLKLTSIAFPSISTGAYGYPVDLAAGLAIQTVKAYLMTSTSSLQQVIFVLFDAFTFARYSEALQKSA
jgi:O-acetyl-ADP-ribose deacetylase